MTFQDIVGVRSCPNCKQERPASEANCETIVNGGLCGWPLLDEPIYTPGNPPGPPPGPAPAQDARRCVNGHELGIGDEICLICGADAETEETDRAQDPPPLIEETIIDGWRVLERIPSDNRPWERFLVQRPEIERRGLLTLYRTDSEPDPSIYEVLRRIPRNHIPELLASGRFNDRAYDITEVVDGGTLAAQGALAQGNIEVIRKFVDELGRALAAFADAGLRHRDLSPHTIIVRSREPIDLVVTSFGSARLSDFDLESAAPLEVTRYSAPESIVGAISAASDWWSLGMIALEQATSGHCFEGVNERAFLIHVVTRGVELPSDLDPSLRPLLLGLLARDPLKRWGWSQVRSWLAGETVDIPDDEQEQVEEPSGPKITLAGREFARPELFALAAAEAQNWDIARDLTLGGTVATWLEDRNVEPKIRSSFRRLVSDENLTDDFKHALALMALNSSLPLILKGEIVTPGWLLQNPEHGYDIVTGEVTRHLERMERELWLAGMRTRAEAVRERARLLEIELDEERLRIALLASSRAKLEVERAALRQIFPDTDHAGLSSLMERPRLSDEDLIILIVAASHQFISLAALLDNAETQAQQAGVALDREFAQRSLVRSRREIFVDIDERTANFARCAIPRVDEWADLFRIERRIPLPRAAALLAVPREAWQEPPRQQYVANLLQHFEKRVSGSVQRGPLVRFVLGKTTPRVDLSEFGTARRTAEAILNHIIGRTDAPIPLDPDAFISNPQLEARLRRLASHASLFRRDTGIDGRYLAFPFVVLRDARLVSQNAKPRIAPVLLWPIALDVRAGAGGSTLVFDREREDIRLNPALEGLLGPQTFMNWREARDEVLGRGIVRVGDVIDIFGDLARPQGRSLTAVPGPDVRISVGTRELVSCAALLNAEFTGQAISEDLRQLRHTAPTGTGLETALRVTTDGPDVPPVVPTSEVDRFLVVESDPSQEAAVLQARSAPGLLIEGPPGTGKSQTIVNMVADAIGRGETVLIVCQKQAALKVVQKRLEAEGLGERLFAVVDTNRDREGIVRALRDQVDHLRGARPDHLTSVRRRRRTLAARIEELEGEIDRNHQALHEVDGLSGSTYRDLLAELIGIEADGAVVEVAALRSQFETIDRAELTRIEETCSSLASLWLSAAYERSALCVLRRFTVDQAIRSEFLSKLSDFSTSEDSRQRVLANTSPSFEIDDPQPYRTWLDRCGPRFRSIQKLYHQAIVAWFELFKASTDRPSVGSQLIKRLQGVASDLLAAKDQWHDPRIFAQLVAIPNQTLRKWLRSAHKATGPKSLVNSITLARWRNRRRMRKVLNHLCLDTGDAELNKLMRTMELEVLMRGFRSSVDEIKTELKIPLQDPSAILALRRQVDLLIGLLQSVSDVVSNVLSCPRPSDAERMAKSDEDNAFSKLEKDFEDAIKRCTARKNSNEALVKLTTWFESSWIERCALCIENGASNQSAIKDIFSAAGTLEHYQRFRARTLELGPAVLQVFATLREKDEHLREVPAGEIEEYVRRIVRREALLAWKGRMEAGKPTLQIEAHELQRKIATLADLDQQFRALNRQLLAADFDLERLGTATQWQEITRLTGPRMKRLREILDIGPGIGLTMLRPIWLMNPDVASRILPRRAKLFDLVVYDEASQMLVEHAVPTLFRASRVVISGDEKQMPPSHFFATRIDSDEDEESEDLDLDDAATESERIVREEQWNRREIKDCPDLLQLGRGVLPSTTLQVHYRSNYRELINYSNAAFYSGTLSVPARHPDDEVRRAKPIKVINVNGVYEKQTNEEEAEQVVEVLAEIWSAPPDQRPTIGVATFNRKQADLVEDAIEQRAIGDPQFLSAYQCERERTFEGEDVGFFVKNVENVQGDERDIIIFSTTFGRDRHGSFRKNFGVLGQSGGERRLNVAVTRAKQKVILLTSMPVREISDLFISTRLPSKPRDYLQAYLDYATKISAGDLEAAREVTRRMNGHHQQQQRQSEHDGFASSVGAFLRDIGYEPVPADDGDAFGLDFAIRNSRTGLFGIGIECDAPRHELLRRARAREIWRPRVLSRAIPVVHRVASHAWYHRPDEERTRLHTAIREALSEDAR